MKRYLTVKQVSSRYGIGMSTVWQWTKEKILPAPIKFGDRITRWDSDDLDEYDKKMKSATAA